MSSSGEDDTAVAPARSTALAVSPSYRADVASAAAEASDGTSSGASSRGQAALLLEAVVATSRLVVTELMCLENRSTWFTPQNSCMLLTDVSSVALR